MVDVLQFFVAHSFMLRALVVGVLISLCCALLGVSLVLKRFSMIGDGLSHVGFGALAIACAANVAPLYFSIPIVLAAAFLLLMMSEKGKIKGDAAIALISTGALAVGVMVTSMTSGMNVDIYNYMFGSILAMSNGDVIVSVVLSVVVIVLFLAFYDEIFAVTFDETFAKATGTKVSAYNFLIAGLTAVTIVVGMRMMGALLISSLIIFPTVTSMRLCKSFRRVVLTSVGVSVLCFLVGLAVSVRFEAPTGASVVCVNIAMLGGFALLGVLRNLRPTAKIYPLRRILTVLVVIVLCCVMLLPFFGRVESAAPQRPVSVVTTGFAPYDFARQVAGDDAAVTMLLAPGEESHTFEPTPQDILLIEQCDVFIYGGGESDAWVDDILSSLKGSRIVVRMMDVVEVQEEVLLDSMEGEADEAEDGEKEYDEHVWTSVANAAQITEAIRQALCDADPAHAVAYQKRAEAYMAQLKAMDKAFLQLGREAVGKSFVVGDRFPFLYFAQRYGFTFYAAFPGCSAQSNANPRTIAALTQRIRRQNLPVVFKVDMSSGNVAQTISRATGAKVLTLYSAHTITAEDFMNGETYLSLMQRNLDALRAAMV